MWIAILYVKNDCISEFHILHPNTYADMSPLSVIGIANIFYSGLSFYFLKDVF